MTVTLPGRPTALPPLPAARQVAEAARRRGAALDADGAFPDQEIVALHHAGLMAAPLDWLRQGEAGAATLAGVLCAIGAGSLPLGRVYEGHVNALGLLHRLGGAPQRALLEPEIRAGRLFGVWNTDDRAAPLRLERRGTGGILRGRKILASGAGWVERPLVTAATPEGAVMVLPHLRQGERADLSSWQASGMRASATGAVDLDGIELSEGEILGAPGDYLRQPYFSSGHWRCLAVQTGGMAELLSLLRTHLVGAGRDGDAQQRARVADCAIALETARLWVDRAARMAAEPLEDEAEALVAYVNLARGAVERGAARMIEDVQRSVGLAGLMRPHPIDRLSRDLGTYLRQPAPDYALQSGAAHVLGQPGW